MGGERKLYELRSGMDLTLEQASACIGINKSTLCRYEQEFPEHIRPEVMRRICTLYHVSPDYFSENKDGSDICWFRIMSPEEVAAAYAALPERDQIRLSRILAE